MYHHTRIELGVSTDEKVRAAMVDAACLDAGVRIAKPAPGFSEFQGQTLVGMFKRAAPTAEERIMSDYEFFTRALSSPDLSPWLDDVFSKIVVDSLQSSEEWWPQVCGTDSLSNFLAAKITGIEAEGLEEVGLFGEVRQGQLTSSGESAQLTPFGRAYPLTRATLLGTPAGGIATIFQTIVNQNWRKIGDVVCDLLVNNDTLSDGKALFHADHSNIGSAGVPSDTTIGEAVKAMKTQTSDIDSSPLNLQARFFVAPAALQIASEKAFKEFQDDAAPNQSSHIRRFYDARLDATSASGWYLLANKGKGIIVYFLDGKSRPRFETEADWRTDSLMIKITNDFAAKPRSYKGLFYNAGA